MTYFECYQYILLKISYYVKLTITNSTLFSFLSWEIKKTYV